MLVAGLPSKDGTRRKKQVAGCLQGKAESVCTVAEGQREVGHRVLRWEAVALFPLHTPCSFLVAASLPAWGAGAGVNE